MLSKPVENKPKRKYKSKVLSDEHKKKISQSLTGRKLSKTHIQNMATALTGKKLSEEHKKKMGESRMNERNPLWKGDDASYSAIHTWIKRHFPPPEKCDMCKQKPPKDLANITGILNRERKNWAYFCRKCHMLFDNILERNLFRFNELRHLEAIKKRLNKKNFS